MHSARRSAKPLFRHASGNHIITTQSATPSHGQNQNVVSIAQAKTPQIRVKRKRRSTLPETCSKRPGLSSTDDDLQTADVFALVDKNSDGELTDRTACSGWLSKSSVSQQLIPMTGGFGNTSLQCTNSQQTSLVSASDQWVNCEGTSQRDLDLSEGAAPENDLAHFSLVPASGGPSHQANTPQDSDDGFRSSSPVLFDSECVEERPVDDELAAGICDGDLHTSLDSSLLQSLVAEATWEMAASSKCQPLTPSYVSSQEEGTEGVLMPPSQSQTNNVTTQAATVEKDASTKLPFSGSFFGLPEKVPALLESQRGITSLYTWQRDFLNLALSGHRQNWILSMPTSGGKTLVAEVLMFSELLCNNHDVLFILPFVSIVQEKVRNLVPFAAELGFMVEEYAASHGRIPPRKRKRKKTIFIATIEKANAVVNSLQEGERLSSLGLVVIDELHMLGEGGSRGATLESCLTTLRLLSSNTWLVGMSATLSNIEQLQAFLSAQLFTSNFRPVKLIEYMKVKGDIFLLRGSGECLEAETAQTIGQKELRLTDTWLDPDGLVPLVLEALLDENTRPTHSCLVFCSTKKNCQSVATMLSKVFQKKHSHLLKWKADERRALLATLRQEASGDCCPVLKATVLAGVAYHHSGLTADERKLIEEAFSCGSLSVLCATTTLAAGVNLPAKRVILRSPLVGAAMLTLSQYKQMVGRAGRAGLDTSGDSILLVKPDEAEKMLAVLRGPFTSCDSSLLSDNGKTLRRLLLTAISLKIAQTEEDISDLIKQSLWSIQSTQVEVDAKVKDNLQQLIQAGFIRRRLQPLSQGLSDQSVDSISETAADSATPVVAADVTKYFYKTTPLGTATVKGSLDVDIAPIAYRDMLRSLQSINLSTDLHLLYLVTPIGETANLEPNWMVYFKQVTRLSTEETRVAELLGISEGYLSQRASGHHRVKTAVAEVVYRRFYLTLLLHQLIKNRSVWDVATIFGCSRGFAQNLFSSASALASCLVHFTESLKELRYLNLLLPDLVRRLSYTVSAELLPLMEIPAMRPGKARQLYAAGYCSMQDVAKADVSKMIKQIRMGKKNTLQIISAAKIYLQEKADALREEADDLYMLTQTHSA